MPFGLHVEPEQDDIAVLHDVILALGENGQRDILTFLPGPERLRQMMVAFKKLHPEVEIQLKYVSQSQACSELLRGKCDLAASGYEELKDADVYSVPLLEAPIQVAMSRKNPLSGKERLTLADLEGQDLILLDREAGENGHSMAKALVQTMGIDETNIRSSGSMEDHLFQVELNLGFSFLPRAEELESENMVFLPLEGFDSTYRIGLFYREETALVRAFLRLLK